MDNDRLEGEEAPPIPSPLRITIITAATVFAAELLVMFLLGQFDLPPFVGMLADSTMLITLCLPALLFFVYRPMVLHLRERRRIEAERERLIAELRDALAQVRTLSGLLPVCAWCKKIRDDQGEWKSMEEFLSNHSDAEFTHSMCQECFTLHSSEIESES
jgi:hypothetical protein